MSEYISMEIDLEILDMLIEDAAAGTEYWSAQNNRQVDAAGNVVNVDASGFYNTQGGWFQTLGTKLQKLSNRIHRYDVYKNPYMNENVILMGYRGSQFLESGAVFAPYIPLIMTPLIYDPETFTPRKGLLTRYAKKMIRPEFYGKVYVNGLNTL